MSIFNVLIVFSSDPSAREQGNSDAEQGINREIVRAAHPRTAVEKHHKTNKKEPFGF